MIRDEQTGPSTIRWSRVRALAQLGCFLLVLLLSPVEAAGPSGPDAGVNKASPSLSEIAAGADLVAVVRVSDTDYVYTRNFPSEGSAYLKILISYKPADTREEIIEVYEKGLHEGECYFENPVVFEEGRRYLGFFRRDEKDPDIYRGLATGCALEILVTADNRYALRLPLDDFGLEGTLDRYATAFDFRDSYAIVEEDDISPDRRNELLARDLLVPYQGKYKYTQGIDLTTARELLTDELPVD